MAEHAAFVTWQRAGAVFMDNRYSRGHSWRFDGGLEVPASSSPHVVPVPMSVASAVDPEEAFVASLASCHMLWFLSIAANRAFLVESYDDAAVGTMGRNALGKMAMETVTLRPLVVFGGQSVPSRAEILSMHHEAHEQCYIASSVTCEVRCEPREGDVTIPPAS
jgi:organic hydroperoxide reductase OsmC/OhrA